MGELKAAFKAHKPEFATTFEVGNDFNTMLENKDKNLVAILNGVNITMSTLVASTAFDMMKPLMVAMKAISSFRSENTIRYRPDLKESTEIPSLGQEMSQMAHKFTQQTPPVIRRKIKKVAKHCKGLKKMEVRGLPYNWEIDVQMSKVRPFRLMRKFLEMRVTHQVM